MVSIIRYNNSCKVIDASLEMMKFLDLDLSFKIQGAEFSSAYKGYLNDVGDFISWDGRHHLLDGNGKFPPGLFQKVIDFFNERGVSPNIIDERDFPEELHEFDISSNLKKEGFKPRYYQLDAVNSALDTDRGIIRAGTGSGKTLISTLITSKLGQSTLILVIGKDLLYQFHALYSKLFDEEIGIIGDGKCEIKDINIATIWSVGQAIGLKKNNSLDDVRDDEKKTDPEKFIQIKQMLKSSKTVLFDECHLASCTTVQGIAQQLNPYNVYGMSASPWRDDGADLLIEAFLGKKIVDISARRLINEGFLVEPDIRFLAPHPYKYKSGKYPRIYSRYIIENEQRNSMIVKGAEAMVEQGFKPLVLFNNIKHGDILMRMLKDKIEVELLSGKDKSKVRKQTIENLQSEKTKCIIASKIFDIGIDLPMLSGLIIAGGGKSSVRALQRIGRVIRPYPGKKMAAVIDFCDPAPYLKDHAKRRKEIYEMEFKVKWPKSV